MQYNNKKEDQSDINFHMTTFGLMRIFLLSKTKIQLLHITKQKTELQLNHWMP